MTNKKNYRYLWWLELAVIAVAAYFVWNLWKQSSLQQLDTLLNGYSIAGILITAGLVHLIKALRIYIIAFGTPFRKVDFLTTYVRTAFINLLIPFKLGEIYRGYEFGILLQNYGFGYIIVLVDRLMDTMGLILVVLMAQAVFTGYDISLLMLGFLLLIVVAILGYFTFDGLYRFWNHYLVTQKTSRRTLAGLEFLQGTKRAYDMVKRIVEGKFLFLFILSIMTWMIEIGALLLIGAHLTSISVSGYLSDIMVGRINQMNCIFIWACMAIFAIGYVACKAIKAYLGRTKV